MAFDAPAGIGQRPGQFQHPVSFAAADQAGGAGIGLTALRSAHADVTSSRDLSGTDVACSVAVPFPLIGPTAVPMPVPLGPVFTPVMVYPPDPSGQQPGDPFPTFERPESPPEGLDPHHREPTPPGEDKKKKKKKPIRGFFAAALGAITFSTRF